MNLKHLLTLTLFLPSLLMAQSKVQSPDGNLTVEITADGFRLVSCHIRPHGKTGASAH